MTLVAMRLRGALNGMLRAPLRTGFGVVMLGLVFLGVHQATVRAVRFLDGYPEIGTIADAVALRSLEGLFTVLMVGVAFSVLTGAIGTLYGSADLPLLLALPLPGWKVFGLKAAETYVSSAALPALFTLPVLVGLGMERAAPVVYYPLAFGAVAALYALPVALGALLALGLVRLAPEGRAKEVATAVSVLAAAGLVFGLRALRPEQLTALSPEQFEELLQAFARLEIGWLPSTWASDAVWRALSGEVGASAAALAALALALLGAMAFVAARAYALGWLRALDAVAPAVGRKVGRRVAAWWERPLAPLGSGIVVKDLRLLARDAGQWSQVLVLLALGGVYFISTASLSVGVQTFRDAIGALNVALLAFLLAGVGVRVAFPLVSLEGEGFWLVRTAPVRARQVVLSKFLGALPLLLALGVGLGVAVSGRLELSPALAFAAPLAGGAAAFAVAGLGVGLGAAFPRFDAANPAEIPMSTGGVAYMVASMAYAAVLTLLFAYPSWRTLRAGASAFRWASAEGALVLGLVALVAAAFTVLPLVFGSARLARWEPGRG